MGGGRKATTVVREPFISYSGTQGADTEPKALIHHFKAQRLHRWTRTPRQNLTVGEDGRGEAWDQSESDFHLLQQEVKPRCLKLLRPEIRVNVFICVYVYSDVSDSL